MLRSRWAHAVLWTIAGIALLIVVVWLAVPPIAKSQVEKIASEQLGRKVTLGSVSFRPWSLELEANRFAVATADGKGVQLLVPQLYINASIASLFKLGAVIDTLAIGAPSLYVTRLPDGSWDFDDVLARLSRTPSTPAKPGEAPFPMVLRDVRMADGAIHFVDQVASKTQEIANLNLRLPELSSLESARSVAARPTLSFTINGVPVDLSARTTPFADDRHTEGTLRFDGLDVAPYLPYIPADAPVALRQGKLAADLSFDFRQQPELALAVGGAASATQVSMDGAEDEPLLAFDALRLVIGQIEPFARKVQIGSIELDAPRLAVRRRADGRVELQRAAPAVKEAAKKTLAAVEDTTETLAENNADPAPAAKPWTVAVDKIALRKGQAVFVDQSVSGDIQAHLRDLQLDASAISLPFEQPMQFDGSALVGDAVPGERATAIAPITGPAPEGTPKLSFKGHATDQGATVEVQLTEANLKPFLGYIPASVPVQVKDAALAADLKIDVTMAPELSLTIAGQARARKLDLRGADGRPLLAVDALDVDMAAVQPLAQQVRLDKVRIDGARFAMKRLADGRIDLGLGAVDGSAPKARAPIVAEKTDSASTATAAGNDDTPVSAATPAPAETRRASSAASPGWQVALAQLDLSNGQAVFVDEGVSPPAASHLRKLQVQASDIGWPLNRPVRFEGSTVVGGAVSGARSDPTAPISDAAADESAPLTFSGSASATSADAKVKIGALPLAIGQPYLTAFLKPSLTGTAQLDADISWKAGSNGDAARLLVTARQLDIDQLALTDAGQSLASVASLKVADARISLAERTVQVGSIRIAEPKTQVTRDTDGSWMFQRWLVDGAGPAPADAAPGTSQHAADAVSAATPAENASDSTATLQPASVAATDAAAPSSASGNPPGWKVQIGALAIDDGAIGYSDRAATQPVQFELSSLAVSLSNATLGGAEPAPLRISTRISTGGGEPGTFAYDGQVAWSPQVRASGTIDATRLPVHEFEPYFGQSLNLALRRADTSFKGKIDFEAADAGPRLTVEGDLKLENLRADNVAMPTVAAASAAAVDSAAGTPAAPAETAASPATAELKPASADAAKAASDNVAGKAAAVAEGAELLNLKTLKLDGLKLALVPGEATQVSVQQTALDDVFARVILYPNGRLNLQGLVKEGDASAPAKDLNATGAAGAKAAEAPATASGPKAVIDFGPVTVTEGRMFFTDLLIQPNYSANLSKLTGALGAFTSRVPAAGSPELADLQLTGRTEQSAALEITGKLNPLASPLALDITGKVSDLELPPFSPYAVKYAGHGIERGKLNMNVHYVVTPDGRITATNQLILKQLRFGEKVDGAPNSLPVKLAVSLLADRNGVIDLNLPVSGSLDNPEFSIAQVLGSAMGNLMVKAITSPFSLIASALGDDAGGDSLDTIPFELGSAQLNDDAKQRLVKVRDLLVKRSSLKLTIIGTADLKLEKAAFKKEQLEAMLLSEKRTAPGETAAETVAPTKPEVKPELGPIAALLQNNADDSSPAMAAESPPAKAPNKAARQKPVKKAAGKVVAEAASGSAEVAPVTDVERPALLREALKRADLGSSRAAAAGKVADLSVKQMEALLIDDIEVDAQAMRELAIERGVAVRDFLADGELPKERLFLGQVQLSAKATGIAAGKNTDASPKVVADAKAAAKEQAQAKPTPWRPHVQLNLEAE